MLRAVKLYRIIISFTGTVFLQIFRGVSLRGLSLWLPEGLPRAVGADLPYPASAAANPSAKVVPCGFPAYNH